MNYLNNNEDTQPHTERVHPEETKEQSREPKAPDGGWGWLVVLGSAITHAIIGGLERSSGILYLELIDKFNKSATETAWVISLTSSTRLICGPLASFLGNRFSLRKVSVVGGILAGLACLLASFSENLLWFFFSYSLLGGFGKSLSYTSCMVVVGWYFNKRRGIAVGLATAGVGLGTFILPPLMEWLFKNLGFFGGMLILAGISLNICVCSMLYRPLHPAQPTIRRSWETPSPEQDQEDVELLPATTKPISEIEENNSKDQHPKTVFSPAPVTLGVTPERPNRVSIAYSVNYEPINSRNNECIPSLKRFLFGNKTGDSKLQLFDFGLLRDFHFAMFLLSICMKSFSTVSVSIFIPPLADQKGIKTMEAAFLLSILGIIDIVSRISISVILDLKYVKPYRRYGYTLISAFNVFVVLSYPFARSYTDFVIITIAYGFMNGALVSQKSVIIVDLLGVEKLLSSFGWTTCFQGIGALIGPAVTGYLKDVFITYDYPFYLSSAVELGGASLLLISNIRYYMNRPKPVTVTITEPEDS
ncbi:monocarboxylate transporter 12-like [Argonauta hians]